MSNTSLQPSKPSDSSNPSDKGPVHSENLPTSQSSAPPSSDSHAPSNPSSSTSARSPQAVAGTDTVSTRGLGDKSTSSVGEIGSAGDISMASGGDGDTSGHSMRIDQREEGEGFGLDRSRCGVPVSALVVLEAGTLTAKNSTERKLVPDQDQKFLDFISIVKGRVSGSGEGEAGSESRGCFGIVVDNNTLLIGDAVRLTDALGTTPKLVYFSGSNIKAGIVDDEGFEVIYTICKSLKTQPSLRSINFTRNAMPDTTSCYHPALNNPALLHIEVGDGGWGNRGGIIFAEGLIKASKEGKSKLESVVLERCPIGTPGLETAEEVKEFLKKKELKYMANGRPNRRFKFNHHNFDMEKEHKRIETDIGRIFGESLALSAKTLRELNIQSLDMNAVSFEKLLQAAIDSGGFPSLAVLNISDNILVEKLEPVRPGETSSGVGIFRFMDKDFVDPSKYLRDEGKRTGEKTYENGADMIEGEAGTSREIWINASAAITFGRLLFLCGRLRIISVKSCGLDSEEAMSSALQAIEKDSVPGLCELHIDENEGGSAAVEMLLAAVRAGKLPALRCVGVEGDAFLHPDKLEELVLAVESQAHRFRVRYTQLVDDEHQRQVLTVPQCPKIGIVELQLRGAEEGNNLLQQHLEDTKPVRLGIPDQFRYAQVFWTKEYMKEMGPVVCKAWGTTVDEACLDEAGIAGVRGKGADYQLKSSIMAVVTKKLREKHLYDLVVDQALLETLTTILMHESTFLALGKHWKVSELVHSGAGKALKITKPWLVKTTRAYLSEVIKGGPHKVVEELLLSIFKLEIFPRAIAKIDAKIEAKKSVASSADQQTQSSTKGDIKHRISAGGDEGQRKKQKQDGEGQLEMVVVKGAK